MKEAIKQASAQNPPACRQRITNIGAAELVFLAVCSPRFTADACQAI